MEILKRLQIVSTSTIIQAFTSCCKIYIFLLHVPTDHFMSAVKNFSNAASTFNDWLNAVDQTK